ncbi:MAG: serine hydrolase [Rhodomicrobium sp.]|jgi:beta-lactamase class A
MDKIKLSTEINLVLSSFCRGDAGRSIAFYTKNIGLLHVNGDIQRPVASIMKVPLLMALYDMAASHEVDLSQKVKISNFTKTRYCSILTAFDPGTELTLREVAALSLITSDNPIAIYITGIVGFERVNSVLRRLGCDTRAVMAAGFTEDELGPKNRVNQASANDLILVFNEVLQNSRYEDLDKALANNLRNNRLPALLPDSAIVSHKTGSLNGVINNAGTVRDGEASFTLAVLTDDQADPLATTTEMAICCKQVYDLIMSAPSS